MNTKEYNLNQLMEECAEVIQAASKQKRFGAYSNNRGDNALTNREHLRLECMDVMIVVKYLEAELQIDEITPDDVLARMEYLQPKIVMMRAIAEDLGTLSKNVT